MYSNIVTVMENKSPNSYKVPHLPVPELNLTVEKYFKTVTPFLTDAELNTTRKLLDQFSTEGGVGIKLQKLLVEKAQRCESWLAEWWLNSNYLEFREPTVVLLSPACILLNEDFDNESERLQYTAKLILAAMNYKLSIDRDEIPVDKIGNVPTDMSQYKKIFGTCRIPYLSRDRLEFNLESRHIVVVRNNNFFKLEVLNNKGEVPSLNQLISRLSEILENSEELGPAIGVLTSEHRDTWAQVYQHVLKDPTNKKSIYEIQKSLFIVALDNQMPESDDSPWSTATKQSIHGGGSRANSANRWFDKTIQFVIAKDRTVGLTYEHSPADGQPMANILDHICDYIKRDAAAKLPDTTTNKAPEKLDFNTDSTLEKFIEVANINVDKLVAKFEVDVFKFTAFGKEFVKSQNISPDSFIQMALQLAFFRIYGFPAPTYEAASTRKYLHGRTETIRSCSNESLVFSKIMLDKRKSCAEKVAALRLAVNSHKKYANEAVNGFGVDRHLLGLKLIARENGIPEPAIFQDPSFTRSSNMRIISSQVSTKCDSFMSFAPFAPDGYACWYNPKPYSINFTLSAFADNPDTSPSMFRKALEASLIDMHDVLVRNQISL